jgi:DNA (cytosine-5)-methyltransferase 1
MTKFKEWPDESIELLVGGTPCQSFSVAGLRKGLDDPRGNLMLTYLAIAEKYRPEWLVWENVPGVLSSNRGRDFGTFLGALGQLGYGYAYRVLDAQYFGVAQRRRRVFVVANLRDWRRAAAVLLERESLRGNPPPSRQAREAAPSSAAAGLDVSCVETLTAGFGKLGAPEIDAYTAIPAVAVSSGHGWWSESDGTAQTLRAQDSITKADTLPIVGMQVRRLTPVECERLQGFPDDYTNIPWRNKPEAPDGPRYKALGNSMAVPVMRWIGQRIQMVSSFSAATELTVA